VGTRIEELPPLPQPKNLKESGTLLLHLNRTPEVYEQSTPLLLGGMPFVTIRVGIAGVLLRARVGDVFKRGLVIAMFQLVIAGGIGFLFSRVTTRSFRELEAGVAAIREGRFDRKIPESGLDEFSRLARDLNLLSEQFQKERADRDVRLGSVRQTVELLGEGLVTLGPEREVVLINGPACRILDLDPATAHGRPLSLLLPETHPVRQLVARLLESGEKSLTIPLPDHDGGGGYVAVGHTISGVDAPGGVLVEFSRRPRRSSGSTRWSTIPGFSPGWGRWRRESRTRSGIHSRRSISSWEFYVRLGV
jgi:PAS domain-containing protein